MYSRSIDIAKLVAIPFPNSQAESSVENACNPSIYFYDQELKGDSQQMSHGMCPVPKLMRMDLLHGVLKVYYSEILGYWGAIILVYIASRW